jgi:hypothetical protein
MPKFIEKGDMRVLTHYQPICLLTIRIKIVAKIGFCRSQTRFVTRRSILDNAVLALETVTWTEEGHFTTKIDGFLSFILSFLFPERLLCCYIYFHYSYLYKYYNLVSNLVHYMLSWSISY